MTRPANECRVTDQEIGNVKTEEDTAPEGGWSWLIVVAIALSKMAFWGTLPCFALVFSDELQAVAGSEGASVASVISIWTVCLDVAGLCCPALYRKWSFRQVGVAGGVIFFAGSLWACFSPSVAQLIISYGAIQGLGFGLTMSANLSAFNEHFRRRRTLAMAVAQCANSAGGLALPLVAQALRAAAGARAAKWAMAGVGGAAAAAQLCLHAPPAARAQHPAPAGRPLLPPAECVKTDQPNPDTGPIPVRDAKEHVSKRGGAWARGVARRAWRLTGVDAALLRDARVLLVAGGVSLVHVAEPNFFAMLPLHLRAGALQLSEADAARVVTAANAGDFAGRVALVAAGCWLARRNRLLFAGGALASAVALLALSFMTSWASVLALAVLLGACKGVLYVTFFLTLAEIVPAAKFPSAVAVQFCLQIVSSSVVSPVLGVVRDATGSYPACFRVVAGLLAVCPLAWGLQAALRARRRRQRSAADDAESSCQPLQLLGVGSDNFAEKER